MRIDRVLLPQGPWVHLLVATEAEAWDLLGKLHGTSGQQVAGRVIRGQKARTAQALFDEFGAALQFPYYFGENWAAFDECLSDLEWLPADAYVLLVTSSVRVLEAETPEQWNLWLRTLARAGQEWGTAVEGEFARPPKAFHVILHCVAANKTLLAERLAASEVAYNPL